MTNVTNESGVDGLQRTFFEFNDQNANRTLVQGLLLRKTMYVNYN